ncbi:ATP-dependent helicase [Jatrophihabitans telluris]|uniref:DNA 3'-5' helicase n=1 Tax=Jatrophihabitans telluris TaxID=2038343 RepID=A0ABY4R1K3_9ACTN|nr:ATP-dependent DNA helicase [Jatrophihabitans telluris]UQX89719.1 ATP-dependent helicase [Jatrophihabitans telluris]
MPESPIAAPAGQRYFLSRPPMAATTVPVLDVAQRRIVEHRGGVLRVLAGPGTGKTTTLVESVVDRVHRRGVPVSELLMLTYSRAAAGDLRDRVTARLATTISQPLARTFHSYAFGVLRRAAVVAGAEPPRLLSSSEQDVTLRELLAGRLADGHEDWPAELTAAIRTRAFVDELSDLLMRAIERDVHPETLRTLGFLRGRADWIAAAGVLNEYLQVTALKSPGAFDAPELIQRAIGELRANSELLAAERRARRRIFVDEFQDTDPAQTELLRLISRGCDELVLIGDPDQSIYGFRGAEPYAMSEIESVFGEGRVVPTVSLTVSRRSTPPLVAATRRVAARLPGPVQQRNLTSARAGTGVLDVSVFSSTSQEAAAIATALRRAHFSDGVAWSDMAVLTRTAGTALDTLRRGLAAAGVPVGRAVRGALTDEPVVAQLLGLLLCAVRPAAVTPETAESLLTSSIGGADPLEITRIHRHLRRMPGEPITLVELVCEPALAGHLPVTLRRSPERVGRVVEAGRSALAAGGSPEDVLWAVWRATGLSARLERRSLTGGSDAARADRDLDAVIALFAEAATVSDRAPGAGVGQLYEWIAELEIGDSGASVGTAGEAVAVLTAHASKGLEWEVVAVAGVQDGVWPNLRQRGSLLGSDLLVDTIAERPGVSSGRLEERMAEERRLFYVAVTRARSRLFVSAVSTDDTLPSRFLDEIDPAGTERRVISAPARFVLSGVVAELRAALLDPELDPVDADAAAYQLARLAEAGVAGAHPDSWWGLAEQSTWAPIRAEQAGPVPIRPSKFEAYLDCELKALLTELGAVDASDQVAAALGTLIHAVAEQAGEDPDPEQLRALLERHWSELDFAARWQQAGEWERAQRMLTRLTDWLRTSRDELTNVAREQPFRVVVGDAELAGTVDRLERDASGRLVVIDFKTGKSKPTKDKLAEHAQLGAYQLAVLEGGFSDVDSATVSGGARLVQLGTETGSTEQVQPPLSDAPNPDWVRDELARVATVLRGTVVAARVGPSCLNCKVRLNCPAVDDGRQVGL